MHIPDGYLSPQTSIPLYGVSIVFWGIAIKKVKEQMPDKHIPYLAMAGVFSFLIQMFNIPIPGGTTGHAVGASVISIIMGPWASVIAVSSVLIIQALVFGDGGVTAIGANCFNMAVVIPFFSYWVFRLLNGRGKSERKIYFASFLSGYLGLVVGSLVTALELGIQPLIARDSMGNPLYAPYPLKIAVPAMLIEHLFLFAIFEGFITFLIIRYFYKNEKELIYAFKGGF